jgi:predicted transcriptional regulator
MTSLPLFKRQVLVSIRPNYAQKILEGHKTVELRRRFPEVSTIGATALIYSSSPVQAIVGHAVIADVHRLPVKKIWRDFGGAACISKADFEDYFVGLEYGFAILLKNVKSLDRQLKAADLRNAYGFIAPQSFRYLDGEYDALLSDDQLQNNCRHQRRHRA